MGIRGEQLSANSEVPSQPCESKPPQHLRSPSLGPFLRTQGHLLQDRSAAKDPRSPVGRLGLEGGGGEPLTMASDQAWLPPGGHHSLSQGIQSLGHPDFQFPPRVKLPLYLQSQAPGGPRSLPVPEMDSVPCWAAHWADGGRVTSNCSPWTGSHFGVKPLPQPASVSPRLAPAHLQTSTLGQILAPCTLVLGS